MSNSFITAGLPILSITLAIGALVSAWLRRFRLSWVLLAVSWVIWPLLLMIGLSNNSAHGIGLYYLDMAAMLALPFVTIGALVIAALIVFIRRKRGVIEDQENLISEIAE